MSATAGFPVLTWGRIDTSDGITIYGPTFSQRHGWHWHIEDDRTRQRGEPVLVAWREPDEMGGVLDAYREGRVVGCDLCWQMRPDCQTVALWSSSAEEAVDASVCAACRGEGAD